MRGKYKRKRLNKKYKKYSEKFEFWRENPDKYLEDFFGMKISLWQRLIIRIRLMGGEKNHR